MRGESGFWEKFMTSISFLDLDLFLILPRIIQQNGLFLFYNILFFVCFYGFALNTLLVLYGKSKQYWSFIQVVVNFKGFIGVTTLTFFVLLCLWKIIFNHVIFAKSSLFLHRLFFHNQQKEIVWMAAFATIIFLINLRFLFVKKIRSIFWFNYFTIGLFIFLTFFCISYFMADFPPYVP